jgi:hypothetical protein
VPPPSGLTDEGSHTEVFIDQLLSDGYVVAGVLILAALLLILIDAGVAILRFVWRFAVRRAMTLRAR